MHPWKSKRKFHSIFPCPYLLVIKWISDSNLNYIDVLFSPVLFGQIFFGLVCAVPIRFVLIFDFPNFMAMCLVIYSRLFSMLLWLVVGVASLSCSVFRPKRHSACWSGWNIVFHLWCLQTEADIDARVVFKPMQIIPLLKTFFTLLFQNNYSTYISSDSSR